MAYADQKMSSNRLIALIVVAILHVALGYGLVTGLAYEGVKKVLKRVTTVDIEEEVKKEEPPPPPKKVDMPPPPVAPPVRINVSTAPPKFETVAVAPPPAPVLAPPAPAPTGPSSSAQPKGNPGSWATTNDYPSRALREERSGTAGFRVTVGLDGRVIDCQVTSSSGHADLDQATCANVSRRARFKPAMQDGQPVQGSYSNRVRWVIPQ